MCVVIARVMVHPVRWIMNGMLPAAKSPLLLIA